MGQLQFVPNEREATGGSSAANALARNPRGEKPLGRAWDRVPFAPQVRQNRRFTKIEYKHKADVQNNAQEALKSPILLRETA